MKKIVWVNANINRQPDEHGNWTSIEGRFNITPNYRHTVYPDSYDLFDRITKINHKFDQVRECKYKALTIVRAELVKEGIVI